jgi:hypothetical protein
VNHRRPPLAPLLLPTRPPRTPWVDLLHTAAESLTPPQDEMDPDVARTLCLPWSVRVGTAIIRVVYEALPPLPEETSG